MSNNRNKVEDLVNSLRVCAGDGDGCEGCYYYESGEECFNGQKLMTEAADVLETLWKQCICGIAQATKEFVKVWEEISGV